MRPKRLFHCREGFTLIELLAFVAIIGIMAGAIVSFSFFSSSVSVTSEVRAEVEQNGELILERLTREIEDADLIAYPEIGQTAQALVLVEIIQETPTLILRETIIHQYHDRIRVVTTQGGVTEFSYLTTDNVGVEQLLFLHFGGGGNEEGVSFAFQIYNQELGTDIEARQYVRSSRTTVAMQAFVCSADAECEGSQYCCGGICSVDACPSGGGSPCLTINDCSTQAPYCQTSGADTCILKVPACISQSCTEFDGGPCDSCEWCGNGVIESGEECDDGCERPGEPEGCDVSPPTNNDSCTNACKEAVCGDGIINAGVEECDDGNSVNGDGCDADCYNEGVCEDAGYSIDVALVVEMSALMPTGKELAELKAALTKFAEYLDWSDDKVAVISYGNTATVHQSLATSTESNVKAAIDALIPAGNVNMEQGMNVARTELSGGSGDEQIMIVLSSHDPNRKDAASTECSIASPPYSPPTDEGCGVITEAEAAKPGIRVYSVGLESGPNLVALLQAIRSTPDARSDYYYAASSTYELVDTIREMTDEMCPCGDGTVAGGEECDDGNDFNTDSCTNTCENAECGDSYLQVGTEECDDGGTSSGDGCSATCTVESTWCGNGTVEGQELCDDGKHCEDGTTVCTLDLECTGIGGGTCAPRSNDGCDATCQPEITGDEYCYTENELCFKDSDCYEPDTAACASCLDGKCVASTGCMEKGKAATDLIGQLNVGNLPVFTTNAANNGGSVGDKGVDYESGAATTGTKGDVALDATNHKLYVADTNNNRVLVFDLTTTNTFDAPKDRIADNVLGQASMTANAAATTQSGMNGPRGVALDGNKLYVADTGNNRVLVFDVASITDGENAENVLGQPDFISSSTATTDSGMNSPYAVETNADSTGSNSRLYVADTDNNRVLFFDTATVTDGMSALDVLGQSDFVSSSAPDPPTSSSMNSPQDIVYVDFSGTETLYVADTGNNRVLGFSVTQSSCQ